MADVRTIVVTGATRGIGRALVEAYLEMGHRVAGCGRSADAIGELAKQYEGVSAVFGVVDVCDAAGVESWAGEVVEKIGVPDLLINNAALINANAILWEVPVAEFDALVDVNIKGVANVTRAFLPAMIDAGRGVVVNLSSGWGRSVSPHVVPYCATKWAIEGLTKALAEELPGGMAAVPVSPGTVHTQMLESCFGEGAHYSRKPAEWAKSAAGFLLDLGPKDNGKSLATP